MEVGEEFGGSGLDTLAYAVAMTEISRGCARLVFYNVMEVRISPNTELTRVVLDLNFYH